MVKFDYKRKTPEIEIKGEVYALPVKTAVIIDKVNETYSTIQNAANAVEQSKALVNGISIFIGDAAHKLYPNPEEADNDELSALWFILNEESNKGTNEIVAKYSNIKAKK
ncbi:MAG: hypothetical protein MSH60_05470 [Ruminococcus sp.]|nr:hypothetical protein [Ruminococcus sp.]